MTQTGAALGSPKYMSPEQVAGVPVDGRADLFSLGVVLYEMLTGRNPFVREGDTTPLPVMHRISVEPHPRVRALDPAIPAAFERIVGRALAKQAETKTVRCEDPAVARAGAVEALDPELRAAYQYLAQVIAEVNSVKPQASGPYDVLYIGRLPVSLSDGWIDSRPRRIDGRECCDRVYLRYRVNPEPPARVTIFGADIVRCEQLLKSLGADYAMQVEARTDFGEPRRATFTVNGKLACELELQADYGALAVGVELVNVRRPGKRSFRIGADRFKDVGDELARYILGSAAEFHRFLA